MSPSLTCIPFCFSSMMDYGEKVTADPSTFDDPQYMFLRERLKALKDGWEEVHQMWENRQVSVSSFLKNFQTAVRRFFLTFIFKNSITGNNCSAKVLICKCSIAMQNKPKCSCLNRNICCQRMKHHRTLNKLKVSLK